MKFFWFQNNPLYSSINYLTLNYDKEINDLSINHARFTMTETKQVNFYNYYANSAELHSVDEASQFPPHFVMMVTKKSDFNTDLNTNIRSYN